MQPATPFLCSIFVDSRSLSPKKSNFQDFPAIFGYFGYHRVQPHLHPMHPTPNSAAITTSSCMTPCHHAPILADTGESAVSTLDLHHILKLLLYLKAQWEKGRSVCLPACLSVGPSVRRSVCLSVCPSLSLSTSCLSGRHLVPLHHIPCAFLHPTGFFHLQNQRVHV
jgi:hypothetical protein